LLDIDLGLNNKNEKINVSFNVYKTFMKYSM
jgi:hypothetical protein